MLSPKTKGSVYQEIALVQFPLGTGSNCCSGATKQWLQPGKSSPPRPIRDRRKIVSELLSRRRSREKRQEESAAQRAPWVSFCLPAFKVLHPGTSPAWN